MAMHHQAAGGPGGMPFQQIDPRLQGGQVSADQLLQQRMAERNNLDMALGGKPMHPAAMQQQQQMLGYGMQMPMMGTNGMPAMPAISLSQLPQPMYAHNKDMPNAHPVMIQQFLTMAPVQQQSFMQGRPDLYAQIYYTLQRNPGMLPQPTQQPPPIEEETEGETETEYTESEADQDEPEDRPKKTRSRPEPPTGGRSRSRRGLSDVAAQAVAKDCGELHLPLDFRNDLCDIKGTGYSLKFPSRHNVYGIKLQEMMIENHDALLREPYLYLVIREITGCYQITSNDSEKQVFGKLQQDRIHNGFITYVPEDCQQFWATPRKLDSLTVSFLRFDQSAVNLHQLPVEARVEYNVDDSAAKRCTLTVNSKVRYPVICMGEKLNVICRTKEQTCAYHAQVINSNHGKFRLTVAEPVESNAQIKIERPRLRLVLSFILYVR
jgi:hypothetical protein